MGKNISIYIDGSIEDWLLLQPRSFSFSDYVRSLIHQNGEFQAKKVMKNDNTRNSH